jgi:molybdopterin-guanine dinucleotide biosynthesis protein MobB
MQSELPPVISIAGKKNSGKTTLVVALAAELKRRGYRVASVKHGHHQFEMDHPGRDSWRHFHEGEVEAVLMMSSEKLALVMRLPEGEPDPAEAIGRFFSGRGYDVVLVEGFKHGPFPKVEVFRREVHERPIYDPADPAAAALYLAIVTDDPALTAECPVLPLDPTLPDGSHVRALADLLCEHLPRPGAREG